MVLGITLKPVSIEYLAQLRDLDIHGIWHSLEAWISRVPGLTESP